MSDFEKKYKDLQKAIQHCGLDWRALLEDYYESLNNLRETNTVTNLKCNSISPASTVVRKSS